MYRFVFKEIMRGKYFTLSQQTTFFFWLVSFWVAYTGKQKQPADETKDDGESLTPTPPPHSPGPGSGWKALTVPIAGTWVQKCVTDHQTERSSAKSKPGTGL